jgi:hypothetical protein
LLARRLGAEFVGTALLLIARPAAPLTTFMVGLAAGRAGGDRNAIREAARIALAMLVDR